MNLDILNEINSNELPESYLTKLQSDYLFDISRIMLLSREKNNNYIIDIDNATDVSEVKDTIKKIASEIEYSAPSQEEDIII